MRSLTLLLGVIGAIACAVALILPREPSELYLRAFKHEGQLEVWGRAWGNKSFRLLRTIAITAKSGGLGPKRWEGDLQVPEGFYEVDRFNPQSRFHLSLRLNYPNAADRILSDPKRPGFDINIHGGAASVGCLPLGDDAVEDVYRMAEKVVAGGRRIPVHIFPARMAGVEWGKLAEASPKLRGFWAELQPSFDTFERTHQVPKFDVSPTGRYVIREPK